MKLKIVYLTLRVALITGLLWATQLTPVMAGGVVGTGTPASCTEAALDAALAGGGLVTFNCGAAPHTIVLTDYKSIAENTEIHGGGLISLSGNNTTSFFQVFSGKTLSLRDITLREGRGTFGAIQNFGTLNLTNSQLISNTATLSGGAIENSGELNLRNSVVTRNQASQRGGGIYNDGGIVTIQGSDVHSNTASSGGGIYNYIDSSLLLDGSTLRGNSAGTSGGGLSNDGTLTLTHVTFSDDTASEYGGGLYNFGTASLTHVTFNDNTAALSGGGLFNDNRATLAGVNLSGNTAGVSGGGIHRALGAVSVRASIVAASPSGGNCSGGVTNNGFNLSSDASCGGFNQVANVLLGPLGNNGGPTQTHPPQPGSPAIDFVATNCPPPATDQRGANRPVDGDGVGGAVCDAGAVEYGAIVSVVYLPLVIK